jgi:hypothetical protein
MLDNLRNFSQSFLFKTLVGIIILSFTVWGIGDMLRNRIKNNDIVRIGDKGYISIDELEIAKERYIKQMKAANKQEILEILSPKLNPIILNSLVNDKLLLIAAENIGINISENLLAKQIKSDPAFLDDNKNFSKERFLEILRLNNMLEKQYIESLKNNMQAELLVNALKQSSLVPDKMIEYVDENSYKKIKASLYKVHVSAFEPNDKITPNEIKDYYEKHKQQFATKPYRKISYAVIKADNFLDKVKVDKEEIEAELTSNPDTNADKIEQDLKYKKAEKMFFDQQNDIDDQIASGSTLEELVKENNLDISITSLFDGDGLTPEGNSADLGSLKPLVTEIFKIEDTKEMYVLQIPNQASSVVIRIDQALPSSIKELKTVEQDIIHNVKLEQKRTNARSFALLSSKGTSPLANNNGKISQENVEVTSNNIEKWANEVFEHSYKGFTSEIYDYGDHYVFIKIDEVIYPATKIKTSTEQKFYIQDSLTEVVLAEYISYLYNTYPVKFINSSTP